MSAPCSGLFGKLSPHWHCLYFHSVRQAQRSLLGLRMALFLPSRDLATACGHVACGDALNCDFSLCQPLAVYRWSVKGGPVGNVACRVAAWNHHGQCKTYASWSVAYPRTLLASKFVVPGTLRYRRGAGNLSHRHRDPLRLCGGGRGVGVALIWGSLACFFGIVRLDRPFVYFLYYVSSRQIGGCLTQSSTAPSCVIL